MLNVYVNIYLASFILSTTDDEKAAISKCVYSRDFLAFYFELTSVILIYFNRK